ncbi:hypothetical protein [Polaromonas sp. JS666]|uniref:hypothetical protein n=1 Tax=Polaromonas sp. (strain JS666 / ATCC BAA-500) TaxID=296591 RepID=UPI000046496F|nr:hypothetical protein [Polaromonas sp. JS666]
MLYYKGDEFSTQEGCFLEARALIEALTCLVPGFNQLPRTLHTRVCFRYDDSGNLTSVFVNTDAPPPEG